jgi:hypothetical protein
MQVSTLLIMTWYSILDYTQYLQIAVIKYLELQHRPMAKLPPSDIPAVPTPRGNRGTHRRQKWKVLKNPRAELWESGINQEAIIDTK